MKVLWITNIVMPEASKVLKFPVIYNAGWLEGLSETLVLNKEINLIIASPADTQAEIILNGITYCFFPTKGKQQRFGIKNIIDKYCPDILHLHGTEKKHANIATGLFDGKKTVVSIQGLLSKCAIHMTGYLPPRIINKSTLRNLIKRDNVAGQKKKFEKLGILETKTLRSANHIIGRTEWDYACVKEINPSATYYHCNEVLRKEFYEGKWDNETIDKYNIFFSQATYPIKGFHMLLEAMPIILQSYPETTITVAGKNILSNNTILQRFGKTAYANYIKRLIVKYKLGDKILFTGNVSAVKMKEFYLKSNVFVCASSIENSPNSVCEAMILGMPVVSSNVGGISSLLTDKKEGLLYQPDAPYMLAYHICQVFSDENLAKGLGGAAQERAMKTHSRNIIADKTWEIYKAILK